MGLHLAPFLITAQAASAVNIRTGEFSPEKTFSSFFSLFLTSLITVPHVFSVKEDLGEVELSHPSGRDSLASQGVALIDHGGSRWCWLYFPIQTPNLPGFPSFEDALW